MPLEPNVLYYGDNLDILKRYIKDDSIDLIYLDPPFNSNQDYNVLFAEQDGSRAAAQIKAFGDTWEWNIASARAYREMVEGGGKVSQVMQAFHTFLGENNMLAYLSMMAPRLVELRRVLKPTGSIYLHCDPTASHYLKLLMDAIFEPTSFLNDIVWERYTRPKGSQFESRKYGASTDNILFYSKSQNHKFYLDKVQVLLNDEEIDKRYSLSDEKGTYYSGPLLRSPSMGPRPNLVYEYKGFSPGPEGWRMTKAKLVELDKQGDVFWTTSGTPRRKVRPGKEPGKQVSNLWTGILALGSQAEERLGYPTQKPEALLERIILASSDEGDVVLDPFGGCGTAISVSQRLKRSWIGIDITHLAITLIKNRLHDMTDGKAKYIVIGEPVTLPDAEELAATDKYQFQWWALGLVGARPVEQKKGADKGIDGRIYFHDEADGTKTKQIILSVKGGKLKPDDVRALKGVVDRENAQIGVLISMEQPTKPMKVDAAGGGFYHSPGYDQDYPALQIITIEELLNGKRIDMPPQQQVSTTFKKAPRAKETKGRTLPMPLG